MTADKDLKRLVRARSHNTGESYAVARRRLLERPPGGRMESATLRAVEKPDLGFTVCGARELDRVAAPVIQQSL